MIQDYVHPSDGTFNFAYLLYIVHVVHIVYYTCCTYCILYMFYMLYIHVVQLYYSYNGFGDPLHYKSAEQQYLLHHMRHPVLTAPLIVMWAVPVMTYDRLLLAVMMPLYMAWASAVDAPDMAYVKSQFMSKWQQLLLHRK